MGIVYTDTAPYEVLYTKWISYADVLTLKAVEEMVELYYNSRQYVQSLTYLPGSFLIHRMRCLHILRIIMKRTGCLR